MLRASEAHNTPIRIQPKRYYFNRFNGMHLSCSSSEVPDRIKAEGMRPTIQMKQQAGKKPAVTHGAQEKEESATSIKPHLKHRFTV